MAKLTTAEFIDAIKELSVLELNDLVKACEEEFGVSAAAGVVVAAAAEGAGAAEKDEFDVELTSAGASKVKVINIANPYTPSAAFVVALQASSNSSHVVGGFSIPAAFKMSMLQQRVRQFELFGSP